MIREESPVGEDFINARIHGMRSRLFEGERLRALAESRTLPELFRRIKPGSTIEQARPFEREMMLDQMRELDMLSRFLSGQTFHLFEWLLAQYQLENVKLLLRTHFSGGDRARAEAVMLPLTPRWGLPVERLFETPDLRRFADHLRIPEFRKTIASEVHAQSQEKLDFFRMDSMLDYQYNKKLGRFAAELEGGTRRLVGFDVDMRNALMLLRAKVNYRRDFSEVRAYLAPSGRYLSYPEAERLFTATNLPDGIGKLPPNLLPAKDRAGLATMVALEDALLLRLYQMAIQCFSQSVLNQEAVIGFFYIKRLEFINVIRATESVRHSLPREDVESRLLIPSR